MAKVSCVLYPGGQRVPNPKRIDFQPGELLGSVSGELGLRKRRLEYRRLCNCSIPVC